MKLLTIGNTKTVKGEAKGYLTGILHLAPSTLSGYQTCPMASAGCAASCLNTAGRGKFNTIQQARIKKTRRFFEDRDTFMSLLVKDIEALIRKAQRLNLTPVVRLNGTSDIRWENISFGNYRNIMDAFPSIQFYDYTKIQNRRNLPSNYHLTFSRDERNNEAPANMNVAIVFDQLPTMWDGKVVIDGISDDLRFLDPANVIVGLEAKGKAKKDASGFVVKVA